jgi:membrane protein YqaA with SNARE-associated domain
MVPFALSFMVAAASNWDPVLVALAASLGGTIGELSSYYVGYLGKKLAAVENNSWFNKVEGWIKHYGMWALSFLALQPVIPFDVGGLIAGAARMPVWKYLLAIIIGKFPKYVIVTLAGIGLIRSVPFFTP